MQQTARAGTTNLNLSVALSLVHRLVAVGRFFERRL